ncbi:hypothetical protein AYI69_g3739 [Smittium culicis]|uniref:Peptidase S1 domain-containing protein n=1 Tax=Smittium culicis TaxID=133412 RepID=A0A1R1YIV3_9FUNG|nr:hypothetical protein AYI69_g3739 [Smittium culicis]
MIRSLLTLSLAAMACAQTTPNTNSIVMFIKVKTFDNTLSSCVAIALSPTVFLTSAECVTNSNVKTALNVNQIVLGSTNPQSDISSLNSTNLSSLTASNFFRPLSVVPHENYDPLTKSDNIALLITGNTNYKTAQIYSTIPESDQLTQLVGVGQLLPETSADNTSINTGSAGVLSKDSCSALYPPFKDSSDRLFCASNNGEICDLDGFSFLTTSSSQALIGIGSFVNNPSVPTNNCKSSSSATFYTFVGFYSDWIFQNSKIKTSTFLSSSQFPFQQFSSASNSTSSNSTNSSNNSTSDSSSQSSSQSSSSSVLMINSSLLLLATVLSAALYL